MRAAVTASNTAGSSQANSAQTAVVIAGGQNTVTFSVSAGGDDGDTQVVGNQPGGYPPSGAADASSGNNVFTAGRRLAFGQFRVLDALLRFNTSSLPDNATITSVKLRLHVLNKADANDRALVGEWYDAANWPIDGADWTLNPGNNALAGADITALTLNATAELALGAVGNVSLTGYTALRLGVNGGQPSGDNFVQMATLEHTSAPEPQLIVTYTLP